MKFLHKKKFKKGVINMFSFITKFFKKNKEDKYLVLSILNTTYKSNLINYPTRKELKKLKRYRN
jgi:acetamidase/formamidase